MGTDEYVRDFAQTLNLTDKVQPLLAVVGATAAAIFALGETGLAQILAIGGAVGLIVVLVASVAMLVPLQRRIIASGGATDLDDMRARWGRGNLGRSVLSVLAFAALAAAAATQT
jgi:hypothetical protein